MTTKISLAGDIATSSRPMPNKRKPGPIPRDVVVRRPTYTPGNSPSSSPNPYVEEVKAPVSPPPNSCGTLPGAIPRVPLPGEKLVNGLGESSVPTIEPAVPMDVASGYPTSVSVAVVVAVSDVESRTERTESVKMENECQRLSSNAGQGECVENSVRVTEEPLTNHVEEAREPKQEKERVLSKVELENIRQHNLSLRRLVYKEVRRKGASTLRHFELINYSYRD